MTSITPRHPRILSAACLALVAVATTAAVRAPRPTPLVTAPVTPPAPVVPQVPQTEVVSPSPTPAATVKAAVPKPASPQTVKPVARPVSLADTLTVEEIRTLIAAHHPSVLTGDPDINTVTLIVNARGGYVVSAAESRPLVLGRGRGGRGRVGGGDGVGAGSGAGGGAGFGRGRVGGGAAVQDSAAVQALANEVRKTLQSISRVVGDTVFVHQKTETIVDGVVSSTDSTKILTAGEFKYVADVVGLNSDIVSRLIDPQTIGSIQIHTFEPGQLGATMLTVFVVRQKP